MIAIIFFLLAGVLITVKIVNFMQSRAAQQRRAQRVQPGAPGAATQPQAPSWYQVHGANVAISVLLGLAVILAAPEQSWKVLTQHPLAVLVIFTAIAVIALAGPANIKKVGFAIMLPVLIIWLAYWILVPAFWTNVAPQSWKEEPREEVKAETPSPQPSTPQVQEVRVDIKEIQVWPDRLSEPYKKGGYGNVCFDHPGKSRDIELFSLNGKPIGTLFTATGDQFRAGVRFRARGLEPFTMKVSYN